MKKSAKIYAVLIALALLFAAGCGRKTADSDNVERSNELPSFISETTTTANDEVSTEKKPVQRHIQRHIQPHRQLLRGRM